MSFLDFFSHLSEEHICRRCAGRLFAQVGHSMDNNQRGDYIQFTSQCVSSPVEYIDEAECKICKGIFKEIPAYSKEIERITRQYDFTTILMGSTFDPETIKMEEEIQSNFGSKGEPIKKEFSRELGKYFTENYHKEFDRNDPDVMVKVNTKFMSINLQIKSIFVFGTYKKLRRGIPQTRWIKFSEITDTVELIIGEPLLEIAKGDEYTLHGAGREDVDVKMLGNGREFVLEIKNPKNRNINLGEFQERVNESGKGVEIADLRLSSREEVRKIKDEKHIKVYRATLESENKIDCDKLKEVANDFNGKVIYQRTPLRVSSSRSDLIRERKILKMEVVCLDSVNPTLIIEAEAGTYIKELVSGDQERTKPSVSEMLNQVVKIKELDVILIKR
jgi:tRNA pseudouridine synthase 10